MSRIVKKVILYSIAIFLLSMVFSAIAFADDGTTYYLKFGVPFVDVSGDFNGTDGGSFESNANVSTYIPELETGRGFEIAYGGVKGHWGGEIYFVSTNHDVYYNILDVKYYGGDGSYRELGANIKYYFADYQKVDFNGYALVGIGYTRITAENASELHNTITDTYTLGSGSLLGQLITSALDSLVGLVLTWLSKASIFRVGPT